MENINIDIRKPMTLMVINIRGNGLLADESPLELPFSKRLDSEESFEDGTPSSRGD